MLFKLFFSISDPLSVAAIGIADKIPQYEQQLLSLKFSTIHLLSNLGIDITNILEHEIYQPENLMALALLALAESGITEAIIVVIGFLIIHEIIENVIKPKFMGEKLDLSLFVIFVSLILWHWILRAMGAILAIPLTISVMKAREISFSDSD